MNELLDIPPPFDRRGNGRCRAYWMAWERCPGNKNPHDYALAHFEEHLTKAKALDDKHGHVAGCKSPSGRFKAKETMPGMHNLPPPPRKRTRKVQGGARKEGTPAPSPAVVEAPAGLEADLLEGASPKGKEGGQG